MTGVLRFPGRPLAAFDCSFCQAFRTQVEVAGRDATLFIYKPFPVRPDTRMILRAGDDTEREVGDPRPDPYRCEVEAVVAAALDGVPLPVPLSSSRANVATLVALYEAARRGTAVRVEL
jgi:predicted dehydrogenase